MPAHVLRFEFMRSIRVRTATVFTIAGFLLAGVLLNSGQLAAQENDDKPKQAKTSASEQEEETTPAEEFAEIKSRFSEELQELGVNYRDAEDQEERDAIIVQRRELEKISVDSAIAASKKRNNENKNVRDLAWFLSQQVKGEARQTLIEEIKKTYLNSKDAWHFATALGGVQSPNKDVEAALRFLKNESTVEKVQGNAAFALVGYLENVKKRRTSGRDAEKLDLEIEELLNECADKFADVKSDRSTIGKLATKKLNLMNLIVGKIAPDIQGVDLDDKEFKLTDYRGKVVVIDFWGDW